MPHALFLGSSLATLDRVSTPPKFNATLPLNEQKRTYTFWQQFGRAKRALFWVQRSPENQPSIMHNTVLPIEAATGLQVPETSGPQEVDRPASQGSPQAVGQPPDVNSNRGGNKVEPQPHAQGDPGRQNNSLEFIKAHLGHAIVDIGTSISVSKSISADLGLLV